MPYYKATDRYGFDNYTQTVSYLGALEHGYTLNHRVHPFNMSLDFMLSQKLGIKVFNKVEVAKVLREDATFYFSISTRPDDCTGSVYYNARLFEVEPVGEIWTPNAINLPNKRACKALRVVKELPADLMLGEHHAQIRKVLDTEFSDIVSIRDWMLIKEIETLAYVRWGSRTQTEHSFNYSYSGSLSLAYCLYVQDELDNLGTDYKEIVLEIYRRYYDVASGD